jgi:hypothetical protein
MWIFFEILVLHFDKPSKNKKPRVLLLNIVTVTRKWEFIMCGTCVTVICGQTGRTRIPVPAPAYANYSQVSIQARVRLQGQLQVSRPIFHSALYSGPIFSLSRPALPFSLL